MWDGTERRSDNTRDLVIETHTKVTDLCTRLLGNGQPGAIAELGARIDSVEDRVSLVETNWTTAHGWIKGIVWIIGGILTLAGVAAAMGVFK